MNLVRAISCFDLSSEFLISEVQLKDFPLETVRLLWDTSEDPQMIGEYEIERKHVEPLKKIIPEAQKLEWDLTNNAYFISTYTAD